MGLKWYGFAQIRLPNASALRALLLSLGINGGLLLALAFTTANKPAGQQRLSTLLLKAVLLQSSTIPQKAKSKPKLVHETNADVEGGGDIKEAKKSVQGKVKCRDHKRFQTLIDTYLNKLQQPLFLKLY